MPALPQAPDGKFAKASGVKNLKTQRVDVVASLLMSFLVVVGCLVLLMFMLWLTQTFTWDVGSKLKRLKLEDMDMKVVVLGNFDVAQGNINPSFYNTGWWYDFFSGDSMNVSDVNVSMSLSPGEYRLFTDVRLNKPEQTLSIKKDLSNGPKVNIYPNPFSINTPSTPHD